MSQEQDPATTILHVPVLLNESIHALNIIRDGLYVDATYGRGGHASTILDNLGSGGCLVVMDRDEQAIEHANSTLGNDPRCRILHSSMQNLDAALASLVLDRKANGILADLGVSSPQLNDPERGFSFMADGPLDMRMDTSSGVDAASWLNQAEESELTRVLREYGEERYARRIARAIVEYRQCHIFARTKQLVDVVCGTVPTREKNKHPATRTFQAVRMRVNAELDQLSAFLPKAVRALTEGGRLVVVSFHSLEDRLVKRFMREHARGDDYPPDIPVTFKHLKPLLRLVAKPCRPSPQEVEVNPRARSAVMRVAERTEHCYA